MSAIKEFVSNVKRMAEGADELTDGDELHLAPRRTILPDPNNKKQITGINTIRIVRDNAENEQQQLLDEIAELETRLAEHRRRLEYVKRLAAISTEYYEHKEDINDEAGD